MTGLQVQARDFMTVDLEARCRLWHQVVISGGKHRRRGLQVADLERGIGNTELDVTAGLREAVIRMAIGIGWNVRASGTVGAPVDAQRQVGKRINADAMVPWVKPDWYRPLNQDRFLRCGFGRSHCCVCRG